METGIALVTSPSRSTKFFARPSSLMTQPGTFLLASSHLVVSENWVSWAEVPMKPALPIGVPWKRVVISRATLSAGTVASELMPVWSLKMRRVTFGAEVGAAEMPAEKARMVEARMVVNCILKVVIWCLYGLVLKVWWRGEILEWSGSGSRRLDC
jgi:hypothetical protein